MMIALSAALAISIGIASYLTSLPVYKKYGRRILQCILCFSLSILLFAIALFFPFSFLLFEYEVNPAEGGGIFFFLAGWIIISYVTFRITTGPAFFERSPRIRDTLRWYLALYKKELVEKITGVPFDGNKFIGPPPSGHINLDFLQRSGAFKEPVPKGSMFFVYGPNTTDLRFLAYQICVSNVDGYTCFICFDQPTWSLLHFDRLGQKMAESIEKGRLWFIDGYTGLFGLSEIASLRAWDLKRIIIDDKTGKQLDISDYVVPCSDIHSLHKRIRQFREYTDKKEGGTGKSNNKIVLVHNGIDLLTETDDEKAYYATHAMSLERQCGWIDVFTLDEKSKGRHPALFQRLYNVADIVIKLSEEASNGSIKRYLQVEKMRWGEFNPSKVEYELILNHNEGFIKLL